MIDQSKVQSLLDTCGDRIEGLIRDQYIHILIDGSAEAIFPGLWKVAKNIDVGIQQHHDPD